jgi:hypothetical protein
MVMKKEKRWIRWNKEVIVIFGLTLFLLVVSIAYAGVLNYYGKIFGSVNIQPPVFIADFSDMSSGWKRLNINTYPEEVGEISISDGGSFVFHTEALGITSFYPTHWKFHVKAKVNDPPKTLYLELWEVNPVNGEILNKICETSVSIISTDYMDYIAVCTTNDISLSQSNALGYRLMGTGGPSVSYTIQVGKKECEWIGGHLFCFNAPTTWIEVIPQD